MLDDISNPVAFATASMNAPANPALTEGDLRDGEEVGEKRERRRTSEKKKDKGRERGEVS